MGLVGEAQHEPHRTSSNHLHAPDRHACRSLERHRLVDGIMAKNGWSRPFEDPIVLCHGYP
jgi:hypothetical protein